MKVEEHQKSLPTVKMGGEDLENTYAMVYLGSEVAGDGDQHVTLKHRSDIARGRFNEYRTSLTSTKLPVALRTRLYAVLVISTHIYGNSAWFFGEPLKRTLNNTSSKMLSVMTKRKVHEKAGSPHGAQISAGAEP